MLTGLASENTSKNGVRLAADNLPVVVSAEAVQIQLAQQVAKKQAFIFAPICVMK